MGAFAEWRPVPLDFSGPSMEVRAVVDDEYGTHHADPVTVGNVLFQPVSALAARTVADVGGGYVFEEGSKGLVFVDAAASPGAFEIPVRSLVSVGGGDEMEVVRVTRLTDFAGNTHHWEVEVR